ncbi:hypothetical protein [Litoreibacter janthinus]|uniref:hypothetical protein n=1 Tax=Litoreibacter janthinus TaxID=670154 RepID=UPI000B23B8F5|nr:hypothetical protein [Litoreibacter janthinus]
MPELESIRSTAEAIGRITCVKTGEEIGLLYQWDNGETQTALYRDCLPETLNCSDQPTDTHFDWQRD